MGLRRFPGDPKKDAMMTMPRLQAVTKFRIAFLAISLILASIHIQGAPTATACKPLGDSQRKRLLGYVGKKYKVLPTIPLALGDESFVSSTCFRKLEFKSADPKRKFKTELYLSPDLRFLTSELLDSSIDPVAEESRKQQALEGALTNGSFPSRGPQDARVSVTIVPDFQCPS